MNPKYTENFNNDLEIGPQNEAVKCRGGGAGGGGFFCFN